MLLFRVVLLFCAHWMASGDLLDLFVEHMDEEMKTPEYKKHHPKEPRRMRNKRSAIEGPFLRIGNYRRQRLDVDESFYTKRKSPKNYLKDALEYPNKQERNSNPNYELLIHNHENTISEESKEYFKQNFDTLPVSKHFQKSFDLSKNTPNSESLEKGQIEVIGSDVLKKDPMKSVPKKYFPELKYGKKRYYGSFEESGRQRRNVEEENSVGEIHFSRSEILDENGDVVLEWDPSDEEIVTFKVTARTLGYIGIGFNEKSHMKGADLILAWVNDHTQQVSLLVNISKLLIICNINFIYCTFIIKYIYFRKN